MQTPYTKQAGSAIKYAGRKAREMRHPYIGTEHLLLGLRNEYAGVAGQVLAQNGVEEEKILHLMDELIAPADDMLGSRKPEQSPRLEDILENSEKEARRLRSSAVGTEHLLLSMIRDVDCVATRILITLNINLQKIFQDIMTAAGADPKEYQEEIQEEAKGGHSMVEQFCTDMTARAETGKLDPVVGREQEMYRLMEVLSRRTKNNPCLIGEPGVGKTAKFLYPNLEYCCASGMSFVTTDTKGDLLRSYAPIAKKYYGYDISVLDLRNPTQSDGFNMLHMVNHYMDEYLQTDALVATAKAEKYAKIISKTVMNSGGFDSANAGQNAFFYDSAEGLITAVILGIAEFCTPYALI